MSVHGWKVGVLTSGAASSSVETFSHESSASPPQIGSGRCCVVYQGQAVRDGTMVSSSRKEKEAGAGVGAAAGAAAGGRRKQEQKQE